ncbi:hypothetical protein [uncultured Alistipes sp.]|uniref:hypothetical protein n=1 Tax=uncultured Alistipes sp. TaxID=538949 RepID=UPI00320ABA07
MPGWTPLRLAGSNICRIFAATPVAVSVTIMEDIPFGFIVILFGFFVGALALTIAFFVLKQKRLQRLKDPRKDHFRPRG